MVELNPKTDLISESPHFPNTIPPFPSTAPTAPLLRISLARLRARGSNNDGDDNQNKRADRLMVEEESCRLFSASKALGFFYLDLQDDTHGEQILSEVDELFRVGEELFAAEGGLAKYDYSHQGSYLDTKGTGRRILMRKGVWIGMSFIILLITALAALKRLPTYAMQAGKDDFLGQSTSPFAHPPLLDDKAPLLRSYMRHAHDLVTIILMHLTKHLNLPEDALTSLHHQSIISGDHVRFIKAPPQPPNDLRTAMGQHTDFGSVTILFNRVGGLQVLPPDSTEWCYVKPLPGHCIVNLGDAMVKFTNGLLRSNLHRVVAPPGEQVGCTRYALVYFARPGDEVPLQRIEGSSEIPPLPEGVVEDGLQSREHIRRMALGKRVNVKLDGVPVYLPGTHSSTSEGVIVG